jgi:hypothetical protein
MWLTLERSCTGRLSLSKMRKADVKSIMGTRMASSMLKVILELCAISNSCYATMLQGMRHPEMYEQIAG